MARDVCVTPRRATDHKRSVAKCSNPREQKGQERAGKGRKGTLKDVGRWKKNAENRMNTRNTRKRSPKQPQAVS